MKKDRNCSTPYPVYPAYQGMGPIPYGMPMIGPNMMPQQMTPMQSMTSSTVSSTNYDQQINTLNNQVSSLEKRVSNLENLVNQANSISNSYNSSNYQML